MVKVKQCLILAGGLGERLKPLTQTIPKVLAPVGNKPFLQLYIEYLASQGILEFILAVGYKHEKLKEHFKDGTDLGVRITYSTETQPLGTAGALKFAEHLLDDHFLIVNGDTYLEVDVQSCIDKYLESNKDILIVLKELNDCSRYGRVELDDQGNVTGFIEKKISIRPGLINAGFYIFNKSVLDQIVPDKKTFP